jgi:RNA polymerase sigma-70 factor, ECF subfamily
LLKAGSVNHGHSPSDDAKLVDLVKNGDMDAFSDLYTLHKDAIRTYCMSFGLDESLANDVVHETFLRIHNGIGSLHDGKSFRPWAMSIARNLILNAKRNNRLVFGDPPDAESLDEDPLSKVIRNDASERLQACIEKLDPLSSLLLQLRIEQELPYREIAAIVDLTEEAVRTRLYRARKTVIDDFHRQGRSMH